MRKAYKGILLITSAVLLTACGSNKDKTQDYFDNIDTISSYTYNFELDYDYEYVKEGKQPSAGDNKPLIAKMNLINDGKTAIINSYTYGSESGEEFNALNENNTGTTSIKYNDTQYDYYNGTELTESVSINDIDFIHKLVTITPKDAIEKSSEITKDGIDSIYLKLKIDNFDLDGLVRFDNDTNNPKEMQLWLSEEPYVTNIKGEDDKLLALKYVHTFYDFTNFNEKLEITPSSKFPKNIKLVDEAQDKYIEKVTYEDIARENYDYMESLELEDQVQYKQYLESLGAASNLLATIDIEAHFSNETIVPIQFEYSIDRDTLYIENYSNKYGFIFVEANKISDNTFEAYILCQDMSSLGIYKDIDYYKIEDNIVQFDETTFYGLYNFKNGLTDKIDMSKYIDESVSANEIVSINSTALSSATIVTDDNIDEVAEQLNKEGSNSND